jgi:hypothetical protein
VAEPDRRENRDEPNRDQSLKSLVEEYLASTREPVGSRNLFRETPDQAEQVERRAREEGLDRVPLNESSAMTLYLVCVAVLLIVALVFGFS